MNKPYTSQEFDALGLKAKAMNYDQLVYSIKDATEALEAVRGHDPIAEGKYYDQLSVYTMFLRRLLAKSDKASRKGA